MLLVPIFYYRTEIGSSDSQKRFTQFRCISAFVKMVTISWGIARQNTQKTPFKKYFRLGTLLALNMVV